MLRALTALLAALPLAGCRCGGSGGGAGSEPAAAPADDPRWPQIEQWARPTVPPADTTLLLRAVEVLEPVRASLKEQLGTFDRPWEQPERLQLDALGPEAAEAIDALVAWHEERGGVPAAATSPESLAASGKQ